MIPEPPPPLRGCRLYRMVVVGISRADSSKGSTAVRKCMTNESVETIEAMIESFQSKVCGSFRGQQADGVSAEQEKLAK